MVKGGRPNEIDELFLSCINYLIIVSVVDSSEKGAPPLQIFPHFRTDLGLTNSAIHRAYETWCLFAPFPRGVIDGISPSATLFCTAVPSKYSTVVTFILELALHPFLP